MSDAFQEFGIGAGDDHVGQRGKRFKAEKDRRYRASFAWWPKDKEGKLDTSGTPNFVGAQISYIQGVGYVVNTGPEFTKLAGKPPTQKVATVIIVWPLDSDGKPDKKKLREAEVLPWVFSGDKYTNLKAIHGEFPFGEHDVTISCTDAQFQKLNFTPCRGSVLAKLLSNEKAASIVGPMMEQAEALASTIRDEVGREMTLAQVQEKLAGGGGGGGPVAGGAPPAADGDIDDLVDGMLDDE